MLDELCQLSIYGGLGGDRTRRSMIENHRYSATIRLVHVESHGGVEPRTLTVLQTAPRNPLR